MFVFTLYSTWLLLSEISVTERMTLKIQSVKVDVSEHWEGLQGLSSGWVFHLVQLCSVQACICFSVCVQTPCKDGVFSSDWQTRWPHWSLQMVVWPLRCSSPRFSSSLCSSPSLSGPPACLLSSLSVKDFDRKGNLTLGMGQRWRKKLEDSGGCIPATLHSESLQVVLQPSALFLTSWQCVYLLHSWQHLLCT